MAPYPSAKFYTEELFDSVVADVRARVSINPARIYLLAWSSGGPPSYSIALGEDSQLAGAFIAMSVFDFKELAPYTHAKDKAFYPLQSPDDRVTAFYHAETAQRELTAAGAKVQLQRYPGGHGWHGNVWKMLSEGIRWLEDARTDAE